MDAVVESFRPKMMDLARRLADGDQNVAICLIGYTGANPGIAKELHDLFNNCMEIVEGEKNQVAVA